MLNDLGIKDYTKKLYAQRRETKEIIRIRDGIKSNKTDFSALTDPETEPMSTK